MTARLSGDAVRLEGDCAAEDAEALLALLQAAPGRAVDLAAAGHLHAAVVQVLLALRPPLRGPVDGPADDPFVRDWLAPLLADAPAAEPS